jgi:hypothetical protein
MREVLLLTTPESRLAAGNQPFTRHGDGEFNKDHSVNI